MSLEPAEVPAHLHTVLCGEEAVRTSRQPGVASAGVPAAGEGGKEVVTLHTLLIGFIDLLILEHL